MKTIHINENLELTHNSDWFPLDNAAKIFPANATKKWNMVYRVAVVLNETVDAVKLQDSLEEIIHRFPIFQCTIKRGLFWYFFEKIQKTPYISIGDKKVCAPFELQSDNHLFRICVNHKRIALEIFHSVTDGCGSIKFFNTLLKKYFEKTGHEICDNTNLLDINDNAKCSEIEDSYLKHADLKKFAKRQGGHASSMFGTKIENHYTAINMLEMKHHQLNDVAKRHNCSVTHLLTAILLMSSSMCKNRKNASKPVVVEVPIDLRNVIPSETMRNFTYFSHVQYDIKSEPFDLTYIIEKVKSCVEQCKNKEWLLANINANVRDQQNKFLGAIPLSLKNVGMRIASHVFGERSISFSFSALGKIKTPNEFHQLINRFECAITPPKTNCYACSSSSFNNNYILTFSKNIFENEFEKNTIRLLESLGINITLESNMPTRIFKNLKKILYSSSAILD